MIPDVSTFIAERLHTLPFDRSLAFLFPGQGSQHPGMGADLWRDSAAARAVYEEAEGVLGPELRSLCFEGPEEVLRQTKNAQNAIMVTSLAYLASALESGVFNARPVFMAGHSLGEYTALVAAGSLAFPDAIRLVARRGELMQAAGETRPGTMAAIIGMGDGAVEEICLSSGAQPCNYNAPGQVVVGGTLEAVNKASSLAKEAGCRALPLNVSGAFHTSLLNEAAEEFRSTVAELTINEPMIPVLGNASGAPLTTSGDVRTEISRQMTSAVLWRHSIEAMAQLGVSTFIEVGPGKALTGMMKRIFPQAKAFSIHEIGALPS